MAKRKVDELDNTEIIEKTRSKGIESSNNVALREETCKQISSSVSWRDAQGMVFGIMGMERRGMKNIAVISSKVQRVHRATYDAFQ
ncbi:hypothetical protein JHK87_039189 [Glycine soja]|nr:hypothetical protein JHK87_039189 [Glycine soja]